MELNTFQPLDSNQLNKLASSLTSYMYEMVVIIWNIFKTFSYNSIQREKNILKAD